MSTAGFSFPDANTILAIGVVITSLSGLIGAIFSGFSLLRTKHIGETVETVKETVETVKKQTDGINAQLVNVTGREQLQVGLAAGIVQGAAAQKVEAREVSAQIQVEAYKLAHDIAAAREPAGPVAPPTAPAPVPAEDEHAVILPVFVRADSPEIEQAKKDAAKKETST